MRIAVAGGTGVVGRYVVEAARNAGHDVNSVSRASGVDLVSGTGLADALEGVEVIVDTTNVETLNRAKATAFFTAVTDNLQREGARQGVSRLVTLSIVGLERVPGYGYYQAKLAQEASARSGPLPVTIVRATQFHEFPAQILARTRKGPVAVVPAMRIQPVAARSAAGVVVEACVSPAVPGPVEVAGPEQTDLVSMARAVVRHRGARVAVVPVRVPGGAGKAIRSGGLLPSPGVRLVGPTFAQWLDGGDLGSAP